MSENLENRISSTQAKDAIYKAHNIKSNASQIDNSVMLTINVKDFGAKGDGITDDTLAIQNAIDSAYNSYITDSNFSRVNKKGSILIPYGMKCKVDTIYIKSGIEIDFRGILIPLTASTDVVRISGSFIDIPNMNIDSTTVLGYNAKLLSIDTQDAQTKSLLDLAPNNTAVYINAGNIYLKNRLTTTEENIGLYIRSNSLARGISWIDIQNLIIIDSYHGIVINANNDSGTSGYVNSNRLKGEIINSKNAILLNNTNGEISSNSFNVDIQPRVVDGATGIVNYFGNRNTFDGSIWDWSNSYGYINYTNGNGNIYGIGYDSIYFSNKVMVAGLGNKVNSYYESSSSFNLNYNFSRHKRNAAGYQDNLLANADKLYTLSATPSGNSNKNKYLFSQPEGLGWYNQYSIVDSTSTVEITITGLDMWVYALTIGFGYTRAQTVKIEYKNASGIWVQLKNELDNRDTNVIWRDVSGDGKNITGIRYTLGKAYNGTTTGVNPTTLTYVSNGVLDVGYLGAFGLGKRKSFLKVYDNEFINMSAIEQSLVTNNSFFIDSSDNLLKFKNSTGVIKTIQLL